MNTVSAPIGLGDYPLDILGQSDRINRLFTQVTFCFELPAGSLPTRSEITNRLSGSLERLSTSFPWLAGHVIAENGVFKIKPARETVSLKVIVEECGKESSSPEWHVLRRANFPFSMLDEAAVAPCKTLAVSDASVAELPVFLVQASFITGGLLLTVNGQHGSMDMAGLGQVAYWFAKACRNEPFTPAELAVGNMSRGDIVPLLDDHDYSTRTEPSQQSPKRCRTADGANAPTGPRPLAMAPSSTTWAYFSFSAASLAALKSSASSTVPAGTFVSTDDALTAFTWQRITQARLARLLPTESTACSTLSRNVDMRHYLGVPPDYPGLLVESTVHAWAVAELPLEPLGRVAAELRAALDGDALRWKLREQATRIARREDVARTGFAATSVPGLDVRLSSWMKERCCELDWGPGLGRAEAVRRPRFVDGAREGLVYFLPKTVEGEVLVGVCLRDEDLARLREDEEMGRFATYVG